MIYENLFIFRLFLIIYRAIKNMTLTFEERLTRLADTDINMDRIRNIEKCFGNDNKVNISVSFLKIEIKVNNQN